MATHVKVLGWLHLIFGALGLLAAFVVMGGTVLGGFFSGSLTGLIGLSMIGTFAAVIIIAYAIPGLLAGYGLLKFAPWARVLTIVLALFELFRLPFGTCLGIYSLWVLLSADGAALFRQRAGVGIES
jgi:hypothetical protein